jgi:hypothetical protein
LRPTVLFLSCAAVLGVPGCTPTASLESSPPPPTLPLSSASSSNRATNTAPTPSLSGRPSAPDATSPSDSSGTQEADASPVIREEKDVLVDGVSETWRLVWRRPPKLYCVDDWGAMYCMGLAFGEQGDLDLVRLRPGSPEERLNLSPLFGPDGPSNATLQHWDRMATRTSLGTVAPSIDESHPDIELIKTLPVVDVMKLHDYDHDGWATEFELRIVTNPFAWPRSAVVGVSKQNRHLHAFDTVEQPGTPLIFPDWGSIELGTNLFVDQRCGYRNATEEATRTIRLDVSVRPRA